MTPLETQLFRSLPGRRFSFRALALSAALHGILLILLLCLPLSLVPQARYRIVHIQPALVLPDLAFRSPAIEDKQVIRAPLYIEEPKGPSPIPTTADSEVPDPRPSEQKSVETEPLLPRISPPLSPGTQVRPDVAVDEHPALTRPPREILVSGFDDRADVVERKGSRISAEVLGSFDATADADDGASSSRKRRGIIVGAGFSAGVVSGSNGDPASRSHRGSVREGSFGDSRPAAPARKLHSRPVRPDQVAVEIISKPRPQYTKSAREMGLEGDVILEVLFTASGDVRVLRLIRGLGHGLDEAAMRAAEQIRFKPAESRGQPVDSRSVVQIIFRLT